MNVTRPVPRLALLGLLVAAFGCGAEERAAVPLEEAQGTYTDPADSFPRVEYPRDGVTLNERCMVRMARLNRRMPPMFVNNFPVGFC